PDTDTGKSKVIISNMCKHRRPYLLVSKTLWSDVPRIRHQIARLLASNGHQVFFVQKNTVLGPRKQAVAEDRITLLQHGELLRHQLRCLPFLSRINARYEGNQLCKLKNEFDLQNCIVLNFNYDSDY